MDTATGRRLPAFRLLLLLLAALGVTGMHTLGHPETAHGHGTHGAAVAMAHMHGDETRATPPGMAHADPAGAALPDLDPSATCLAVLTSLLLALVTVLIPPRRDRHDAPAGTERRVRYVPRPPPRPIALDLTRVAVLRI